MLQAITDEVAAQLPVRFFRADKSQEFKSYFSVRLMNLKDVVYKVVCDLARDKNSAVTIYHKPVGTTIYLKILYRLLLKFKTMSDNLPIKKWAIDDRPREKLMNKGSEALSNAELLAILLNNGNKGASALDLAKDLLQSCHNRLHQLSKMSVNEILEKNVRGIGPAKAVMITAALSLSSRREIEEKNKTVIKSSSDIAQYLRPHLQYLQYEAFLVIFLNMSNHILCHKIISNGGITSTVVDIRIIFKLAFQYNATGIILAHNHPSGSVQPSKNDLIVTKNVRQAGKTLDIEVLDHLIISDKGYFSFLDADLFKS